MVLGMLIPKSGKDFTGKVTQCVVTELSLVSNSLKSLDHLSY